MNLDDIQGAQLAMHYLAALVETPGGRAVFCSWAFDNQADLWRAFARSKGRPPDDPVLAQEAVLAAQQAAIEAARCVLEGHAAQMEVQQIIEGGGGEVV